MTAGRVNLMDVPAPIQSALTQALQSEGWSVAPSTGDIGPGTVSLLWLADAAACEDATRLAAGNLAGAGLPAVVLLLGETAAAQTAAMALPTAWVRAVWPCPPGMLSQWLRHALQLAGGNATSVPATMQVIAAAEPSDLSEKRSSELQRLIQTLTASGMYDFEYDLATQARHGSARDHQIIGRSPVSFESLLAVIHPEDHDQIRTAFERSRATGCRYQVACRTLLKDGTYCWFRSEGAVVDRTQQHPGRLLGVSWDVNEEHKFQELARQAKRRMDQALMTFDMLSWEWTADQPRRLVVGDGVGLIAPDASATAVLDDCVLAQDRAADAAIFSAAINTASSYHNCIRVMTAGGRTRLLQLTGQPRRDVSGQVVAMSGLGLDITERRAMDEELADARALLIDSLNAARMYCWEWNLVDGSRRTIGPSREMIGVSPEKYRDVQALIHPDDFERDDAMWQDAIRGRGHYHNEFRIVRPDGQIRWLLSTGNSIVDADGKVTRMSGVTVDISDRRFAEQELVEARKLLDFALEVGQMNPWSVDLLGNLHRSGPRDMALFSTIISNEAQFMAMVVQEDHSLVARLRDPEFLASQAPIHIEYRIRQVDGSIRWIACHAQGVCDAAGHPVQLVGISYDVSEARQAQEKLARSLAKLDRVLQATNVVLWEWDRKKGPRCYQVGGIEVAGKELPDIHPDDIRRMARRILVCAASNEALDEEFRIRVGEHGYSWVSAQGRRTDQDPERGALLSGVMVDISGRKKIAEKLATAEERLRRALDAAKMMCWDWYMDDAHKLRETLQTYSPKTAHGAVHPQDQERHKAAIDDVLSGAATEYRCEFRLLQPDGNVTWLLSIGRTLHDAGGTVIGLTGVAIDVSSRKDIEAALDESREWQRLAVSAGELNLWKVDLATGERQGGDLDTHLFGFVPDNLAQVEDMIHVDDRERVDRAWNQSIQLQLSYNIDYRIVLRDGSLRWLRVRGKCVPDHRSDNLHMVGATMDITEQRRSELELKDALLAARQASDAKSAFLAGISHEIRTPLNAVIGFSGLMMASATDGNDLSHLYAINNSANQLLALVNDVLDFSRIEAGEMVIESTRFNLRECLENALGMMASVADDHDLCLLMIATGGSDRTVLGDPMRIRQIVLNLLSNATKFTEHGTVELHLDARNQHDHADICIRVRDSGVGMTTEVMGQLFKPFHQGDVSTTRRFGGTGLGLSISKRILDLMHGSIHVESTLGVGSCFEVKFALPFADSGNDNSLLLAQKRVGIAVDSAGMHSALALQLQAFGAIAEVIAPGLLAERLLVNDQPLDVLVVGPLILDTLSSIVAWPQVTDSGLLPVVVLVGIDQPLAPWRGRFGEKCLPISRIVKPGKLHRALSELLAGDALMANAEATFLVASNPVPLLAGHDFAALRILVVEDNEINQTLILLQLESLGATAMLADSGHEALEMLSRKSYDVVLMDVEMPGMDGMETTRRIRSDPALNRMSPYIVAVTAHVLGDSQGRFMASGMDDFVSKPVLLDKLREALERACAVAGSQSGRGLSGR